MRKGYRISFSIFSALFINMNMTPTFAQNVNVTFSANIIETTCEMRLEGGSGNGINNTIPVGSAERWG